MPAIQMDRLVCPFTSKSKLTPSLDVRLRPSFMPRKYLVDLLECHSRQWIGAVDEHTDCEIEVPHIYTAGRNLDLHRRIVLYLLESQRLKRIDLLAKDGDISLARV